MIPASGPEGLRIHCDFGFCPPAIAWSEGDWRAGILDLSMTYP